jgi:hypothetical protein
MGRKLGLLTVPVCVRSFHKPSLLVNGWLDEEAFKWWIWVYLCWQNWTIWACQLVMASLLTKHLSTSINWLHCYWAKALLVIAWIWQSVACAPLWPAYPARASLLHADTMDWLTERRQSNRWLWAGALMYHPTKICQGFSLIQNRAKSNWQELNISLLHTHLRRR